MQRIYEAVRLLHRRYGAGDLRSIKVFADGRIEIEARRVYSLPHIRRGRVIDSDKGTVRMYGNQLTIKAEGA